MHTQKLTKLDYISFLGPSVNYDSNWTCGTAVLQAAFEAIKIGQCDSAIVTTANLALNGEVSNLYGEMGVLSDDGRTRSFDANGTNIRSYIFQEKKPLHFGQRRDMGYRDFS